MFRAVYKHIEHCKLLWSGVPTFSPVCIGEFFGGAVVVGLDVAAASPTFHGLSQRGLRSSCEWDFKLCGGREACINRCMWIFRMQCVPRLAAPAGGLQTGSCNFQFHAADEVAVVPICYVDPATRGAAAS